MAQALQIIELSFHNLDVFAGREGFPGYNDEQLLRTSRGRLCISNSVGEKEQQLAVEHGSVPTR